VALNAIEFVESERIRWKNSLDSLDVQPEYHFWDLVPNACSPCDASCCDMKKKPKLRRKRKYTALEA
jgi:hypothetical protein